MSIVKAWLRPPGLLEKAFKRFMTWLAEILLLSQVCITHQHMLFSAACYRASALMQRNTAA